MIEDTYGFETSEGFTSDVTDKLLPQIEDWQNCPLDAIYPIIYIYAIHYSILDNGVIRELAAYVCDPRYQYEKQKGSALQQCRG